MWFRFSEVMRSFGIINAHRVGLNVQPWGWGLAAIRVYSHVQSPTYRFIKVTTLVWLSFRGGSRWGRSPPLKTYESNFFRHDFEQFGKQHSQYKAIFPSTVLSQKCCEVYSISLTVYFISLTVYFISLTVMNP